MLTKNTDILRKKVSDHLDADALVKGIGYWNSAKTKVGGKGCFIGCLTHSSDPTLAFDWFGLPVAVLRIAESIFEALPKDEGRAFFADLPDAVGCDGKDLSRVHWVFLAAELRALPKVNADTRAVIDTVISGMDLLAAGKDWPKYIAARAAYAASAVSATYATSDVSVAYAAASAAYAASAVSATYAADAATSAANASTSAANAAAYATDAASATTRAATRAAVRIRQRDTLLHLIATAPVPSGQ